MSDTLSLPVLPLDDTVVLPTMVVPVDTSGTEARAAIAAAQISAGAAGAGPASTGKATPQVLLVPLVNGKYSSVGTLGAVEQIGRLPSGEPAAAIRGLSRVRIGSGTVGPGAALWVEGTVEEEPPASARAQELAREYRGLAATILQKRGAWQVVDVLQRITDPSALADSAGYAQYLTLEQRQELLETIDPEQRLERLTGWARDQLAELDVAETIASDVREGMEKQQREFLLRQQLAAIRKELAGLDGEPGTEERERRILYHLPQVRLIARRIRDRLPESVSLEDLVSAGIVGLIAAVDLYDPAHNVKLKTYAEHRIRGAILDSLRGLDWAPRQRRKKAKQIEFAISRAEQRLHRIPGEEEIAAEMGVDLAEYHRWLVEVQGLNIGSLEYTGKDGEGKGLLEYLSDDQERLPSRIVERSQLEQLLSDAIRKIPPMERTVLGLYYLEELTLREIAQVVDLHESRISHLKSQAILRLRADIRKIWPNQAGGVM